MYKSAFVSLWGIALAAAHAEPVREDAVGIESAAAPYEALIADQLYIIGEKTVSEAGMTDIRLRVDMRADQPLLHVFDNDADLSNFLAANELDGHAHFTMDGASVFKLIAAPHYILLNGGAEGEQLFEPDDIVNIVERLNAPTDSDYANRREGLFSDALRNAAFASPGLDKLYVYAHPEIPAENGDANYLLILVVDDPNDTARLRIELFANLNTQVDGVGVVDALVLTNSDAADIIDATTQPFFQR